MLIQNKILIFVSYQKRKDMKNSITYNAAEKSFNVVFHVNQKESNLNNLDLLLDLLADNNITKLATDVLCEQDAYHFVHDTNDVYMFDLGDLEFDQEVLNLNLIYVNDILNLVDIEDESTIDFLNWIGTKY